MVPLTTTRPEVYVSTRTTIITNSYYYLVDNLNHTNLKLKDHPGRDAADCHDEIQKKCEDT